MDYATEMFIDDSALDMEALEQPGLMMKYSTLLAKAKMERDLKKEAVEWTQADLDKALREAPDRYGLDKVTVDSVKYGIIQQKKYKKAVKAYLHAKHEADILQGAVSAIEQRKSMIETLTKLHGQQYFAGPNVPRDLEKERKDKRTKVDTGISNQLNKRTRKA